MDEHQTQALWYIDKSEYFLELFVEKNKCREREGGGERHDEWREREGSLKDGESVQI